MPPVNHCVMFAGKIIIPGEHAPRRDNVFAEASGYGSGFWLGFGMLLRPLGLSGRMWEAINKKSHREALGSLRMASGVLWPIFCRIV